MRVLIDSSTTYLGGAKSYIRNISNCLSVISQEDLFAILVPPETAEWLSPHIDREQFEIIPCAKRLPGLLHELELRTHKVSQIAKRWKADVLFSATGFSSIKSPCPELVLLRNAIYFCPLYYERHRPQGKEMLRFYLQTQAAKYSMRAAQEVMFPSQAMADEALASMASREIKAFVNHYGVEHENFAPPEGPPPPIVEEIQQWKEEGYTILLHVSMYAAHKNMETVVEALPKMLEAGLKFKWVTTMSWDRFQHMDGFRKMMARIDALGLGDVFVSGGVIPHHQLAHLYHSADAFVFPSLSESFGQPLVEAMSSHLPVIAADRPIQRELGGDAFRYFQTFDADDCARVLVDVLSSQEQLDEMRRRSEQRAKDFSWHKHAVTLLEHLRSLAKQNK